MKIRIGLAFLITAAALFPDESIQAQAPERPDSIYYLTIDPETGFDVMVWFSSPSPGVDYYIVGEAQPSDLNSIFQVGSPVISPDTVFVNINTESGDRPVYYSVFAVFDDGLGSITPGEWDPVHNTIYLSAVYDSCEAKINLSWNNYSRWNGKIRGYNIYRRTGPNTYVALNTSIIPEGTNTYTLDNLQAGQQYDIFVQAEHIDNVRFSRSNIISVFNDVTPGPDYINADFATVSAGDAILLSFTPEIAAPYEYTLERSTDVNGPYTVLRTFTDPSAVIADADSIDPSSGVYYYRLWIKDICGIRGVGSNFASNILLDGTADIYNINLQWNDYFEWLGGVGSYQLIRYIEGGVPDATFNTGTVNSFNDDVSSLVNHLTPVDNRICYEVLATENMNIHGIQGTSLSNRICFDIDLNIRIPNAIIPNDPEPVNRVFEPVFDFAPDDYEIIIYNRQGLRIWEGSGPWDGTSGGKAVPEGVYLYYLRVYGSSPKPQEYSGKLTVLYR